ncbi:MAG: multicopper oxidase domain-containing protein [Aureispira sp.]|nr:multicopper oxidase domain-containing protein [Aureispira sp.]
MKKQYLSGLVFLFFCLGKLSAQTFVNPIPIPYLIDKDTVLLRVDVMQHNFNPNGTDSLNTMITTYAFNHGDSTSNTYLGPSIAWNYGHQVHTEVKNNLPVPTTTHWHGAHVPVHTDGGPHQLIDTNSTWKIDFEIKDKSATMWYHPHAMGTTYEHVQMGLSGMIYVEDPPNAIDDPTLVAIHNTIPHDYGVDDFPIIIQTKMFERDSSGTIQIKAKGGYKKDYQYLVNGVMNPYLEVPANMVRFRILNGDAKFSFNLGTSDKNLNPETFQFIATDAGYTDTSYAMNQVLIPPGARTEWLLDLRGRAGDTIYLSNFVSSIPNGVIGNAATTSNYATDATILKIIVAPNTLPSSPIASFPIALHPLETPAYYSYTKRRTKQFTGTHGAGFLIDNTPMDMMVVNDTIMLDSTEVWTIENNTSVAHPWHIHDIHFFVTEILDSFNIAIDPATLPNVFSGPLDDVLILPGWKLSYVATFNDFGTAIAADSTYMYHCHILPHEDKGMMGQFVVWNGLTLGLKQTTKLAQNTKLFPNPTSNELYLEGKSDKNSQIRLFDLQGKLLKSQELEPFDGTTSIPLHNLDRGLILVEWTTEKGTFINKVLLR